MYIGKEQSKYTTSVLQASDSTSDFLFSSSLQPNPGPRRPPRRHAQNKTLHIHTTTKGAARLQSHRHGPSVFRLILSPRHPAHARKQPPQRDGLLPADPPPPHHLVLGVLVDGVAVCVHVRGGSIGICGRVRKEGGLSFSGVLASHNHKIRRRADTARHTQSMKFENSSRTRCCASCTRPTWRATRGRASWGACPLCGCRRGCGYDVGSVPVVRPITKGTNNAPSASTGPVIPGPGVQFKHAHPRTQIEPNQTPI